MEEELPNLADIPEVMRIITQWVQTRKWIPDDQKDEEVDRLCKRFSEGNFWWKEERWWAVIPLKNLGYSTMEISKMLKSSDRTIRRDIEQILKKYPYWRVQIGKSR